MSLVLFSIALERTRTPKETVSVHDCYVDVNQTQKRLQSTVKSFKSLVKQNIFVVDHLKSKDLIANKIQMSLKQTKKQLVYSSVLFAASRIRRYAAHTFYRTL